VAKATTVVLIEKRSEMAVLWQLALARRDFSLARA